MKKKPELLVPLNDWKTLNPQGNVLHNGDSFYFGVKNKYSMRARAGNFNQEDIPKLVKLIHNNGKKVFLTSNIVVYNEELSDLKELIKYSYESEVDAIICHDIAAIKYAKDIGIPFHVSTQANISNIESALFYQDLGASRIILARELNLVQIQQIATKVTTGIETFIHGAMCTAISGRCYFSAEIMGFDENFSANRGKCVQPCRRMYTLIGEEDESINYNQDSGMFFNSKDLCMIEHINKLIESNISSFKIEGRMRDPLYISETSACYREAIDSYYNNTYTEDNKKSWLLRLNKIFNRGFHTGFYFSKPTPEEIQRENRGNVSQWKKKMIGKVKHHYKKASAVEIELYTGSIQLNDDLIFENNSDFYYKQKVESIRLNNEEISITPNASSKNHITIGVLVKEKVPINANVYIYRKLDNSLKE